MTVEMTQSAQSEPGRRSAGESTSEAVALNAATLRRPLLGALLIAGLLTFLFWDFLSRQVEWAIKEQADWGHTLLIPFIAGYFVWTLRDRLAETKFRTTWSAFGLIILGVGAYTFFTIGPDAWRHHNLMAVGVASTITGVLLLFMGWRALLIIWFPLAYLFVFGQTISERLMNIVTFQMQDITARGAEILLSVMQYDVDREGNVLTLITSAGEEVPLNIAEACSGMRMLMAFLALGAAMAFTGLKHTWQRIILVVMGVPTAIVVNILRVITLSLLSLKDIDFAAGEFHSFIGLVWLLPAFGCFLGIRWIISNLVTDEVATK